MACGVYRILNTINGKFYIGSAINLNNRKSRHFSLLRTNKHWNKHLQRSFNKHGENSFKFNIVAVFHPKYFGIPNKKELLDLEQFYLDKYWDNGKKCYNQQQIAGSHLGIKRSEETKQKQSKASKGKPKSITHKQNISKGHIGINLTYNHIQALSGENSNKAKLNWHKVNEIREKYKTNKCSQRQLAKEYNISRRCIRSVLDNRTWKI